MMKESVLTVLHPLLREHHLSYLPLGLPYADRDSEHVDLLDLVAVQFSDLCPVVVPEQSSIGSLGHRPCGGGDLWAFLLCSLHISSAVMALLDHGTCIVLEVVCLG